MSRTHRWPRWGLFALIGLALSWLVSCSSPTPSNPNSPTDTANPVEIEFWTMQLQPKFTDYFNQLIAQFEQTNPTVKVRWVDVPWAAMESKILTAVSANTAPDVVNLNPNFASQLASQGAWLTLDDRLTPEQKALYLPNIWQASTLNGASFGLPWYLTTRIAIYNKDLFQQAGLSQAPATYEELAVAARQIRDKTGKYAFFITFAPDDSAEVLESLVQMGVDLVDDQGKAAFNTDKGKAAFQYWVDLYQNGLLPREVLTQGHRRAIELYQAGEIAILSSGPEFLSTIATNAPQIAEVSDVAPQISGETGKKNVAVMNLVIPRQTDQPDTALAFALFVTNDTNQLAFAQAANVLPSTPKALRARYEETQAAAANSVLEKARAISASQMQTAEVLVPAMHNVTELQKIIYDNLQAAMLGEKTVDAAINDAATAWDQRVKTPSS
ncbi:ABC transporter substrate-binding protein [Trichothermofontia sp.]